MLSVFRCISILCCNVFYNCQLCHLGLARVCEQINSDRGGYDKTDVDLVGSSRAIDAAKQEILKITSYSSNSSY